VTHRRPNKPLLRAITRPPYRDEHGRKGWFERIAVAQPHTVQRLELTIPGWPPDVRALRIAFMTDFHSGSHSGDVARIAAIIAEAATFKPDLVLYGGDFVNMQVFGGGRVPPRTIATLLAGVEAPYGRFAVLGNHDYTYGAQDVIDALTANRIAVLSDETLTLIHDGMGIDIVGLPDAKRLRPEGLAQLAQLSRRRRAIVLAHDPFWFAHLPAGPYLMLAGHTHGGQIRFPVVGALRNGSRAPMRWSHGHIEEGGRHLYVSAGLGTSGIPLRIGMPPEYAIVDVAGS
jgi:predicted MPP superfamily phosphohydrolase